MTPLLLAGGYDCFCTSIICEICICVKVRLTFKKRNMQRIQVRYTCIPRYSWNNFYCTNTPQTSFKIMMDIWNFLIRYWIRVLGGFMIHFLDMHTAKPRPHTQKPKNQQKKGVAGNIKITLRSIFTAKKSHPIILMWLFLTLFSVTQPLKWFCTRPFCLDLVRKMFFLLYFCFMFFLCFCFLLLFFLFFLLIIHLLCFKNFVFYLY